MACRQHGPCCASVILHATKEKVIEAKLGVLLSIFDVLFSHVER